MSEVRILIGADIVPTKSNYTLFCNGDREALLGEQLSKLFMGADFRLLNLETPLTDINTPILKSGPNLQSPTNTIKGLKSINPDCFGLANNHILDQGEQGLLSTIHTLDLEGIRYVGAGHNLEEAQKPLIVNIKNKKIGIYACAEHEFSIADRNKAGANPYDPLESFEHVRKLSHKCDACIVLYHGGKEFYQFPSPTLQRIFKKFADNGADLVVAQHTHCVGCMEEYKGANLIYGQGNFLFEGIWDKNNPYFKFWKSSLLICMDINNNEKSFSFIPIISTGKAISYADKKEGQEIINEFMHRSEQIQEEYFIKEKYEELALQIRNQYLYGISGGYADFFPIRIMNKLSKRMYLKKVYKGKNGIETRNYIECETHRELLSEVLRLNQSNA